SRPARVRNRRRVSTRSEHHARDHLRPAGAARCDAGARDRVARGTERHSMNAITFAAPIPTYLLTLAAGRISPRLLVGPHACTRYGEVADPRLPGDRWVRIRTRLGGICGSDLAIVGLAASPATSPFSSFPFVIGHENVGVVEAV